MKHLMIISLVVLIAGCTKQVENKIYIRINNTTQTFFANISIANSSYGNVLPMSSSVYKLVPGPIYTPGCMASLPDTSFYIGNLICGTPMPPAYKNGKYTLSIKDSATPGYYEAEMKKDN